MKFRYLMFKDFLYNDLYTIIQRRWLEDDGIREILWLDFKSILKGHIPTSMIGTLSASQNAWEELDWMIRQHPPNAFIKKYLIAVQKHLKKCWVCKERLNIDKHQSNVILKDMDDDDF